LTPRDPTVLQGQVRDLTRRYKEGGAQAAPAFRNLVALLLGITVLHPSSHVVLSSGPARGRFVLRHSDRPLRLNDDRFLRWTQSLYLDPTAMEPSGPRLKVAESSYQYQLDPEGEEWVFRYDYLRDPNSAYRYPRAHLQVRGTLEARVLGAGKALRHVHFPTDRISFEAVLRLLATEFDVPTHQTPEVWRPVLAASEEAFREIAHRPLSGPER
jgi:hypothetical protein